MLTASWGEPESVMHKPTYFELKIALAHACQNHITSMFGEHLLEDLGTVPDKLHILLTATNPCAHEILSFSNDTWLIKL